VRIADAAADVELLGDVVVEVGEGRPALGLLVLVGESVQRAAGQGVVAVAVDLEIGRASCRERVS
jgi:hypothetical protein